MRDRWCVGVAALLLVSLAGCSAGKANVSGKVTHKGKPLTFGTVVVQGPDGVAMTGMIAADGTYAVEGVLSGTAKIGVVSRDPGKGAYRPGRTREPRDRATDAKTVPANPPAELPKWFPIPDKYEDPSASGLTVNLSNGVNTHDIELP